MHRLCVDLLDAAWVWLCLGLLSHLLGFIVMALGLVSLDPPCFLQLSSPGLIIVLLPRCCLAYSAFSV